MKLKKKRRKVRNLTTHLTKRRPSGKRVRKGIVDERGREKRTSVIITRCTGLTNLSPLREGESGQGNQH